MSQTLSASTGSAYGVERVCLVWDQARSTFYDRRERSQRRSGGPMPGKRGPKPLVPDADLLDLIRHDLAASPFIGEGHRKVWGRLRFGQGIRVSRKRVLRLMRENHLLSPYRGRQGQPDPHEGTIVTEAPNLMWGTDGTKVFTLEDGWVWVFVAVEHWNAECVGWHVTKHGDRYAALEPISQGVLNQYGSVAADVARGLRLRMDHGSQYLTDHFLKQVRFWGIKTNFAFVEQPQTNGVAERFNRTLKEQAIYGRIFRNTEDVRRAVGKFVEDYNAQWRVEKNGFLSPRQARQAWFEALSQHAA
jgi:putative transposase